MRPVLVGGFCAQRKKHRPNEAFYKSFINHILLISKYLVEGFVPEIGSVRCLW